MFKRYAHRGHVLLQFIPLRIYKFSLFQFSPRLFGYPNVHSTLRRMNREGFSRRSSTVGPGFITMEPKIPRYAYRQGNSSRKVMQQNLDGAFCILKVTGVLIEKTLTYIFSKIQLFEVQPCADPESYVRGFVIFRRSGPVLLRNPNFCDFSGGPDPCPPSGSAHDNQGSVLKVLCQKLRQHR